VLDIPQSFCHAHQVSQRSGSHFAHDVAAMKFDRSFAGVQFVLAVGQQVISPAQLANFSSLLALWRCFDRIVINGYLSGLS
jgi:hypothetical protein